MNKRLHQLERENAALREQLAEAQGRAKHWESKCSQAWSERDEQIAQRMQADRQLAEAQARGDRLFKDRYDLLNVKTTDGMTASEWLMRTATAEGKAAEARRKALEEVARPDMNRDALHRASFEIRRHFGREGSIFGIKACGEVARLAIVAYVSALIDQPEEKTT